MADPYASFINNPAAPAIRYVEVAKADAELPGGPCKALLVGTAGTANLTDAEGNARTGVPLQQGYNPLRCQRVNTGGTAANIWALY